MADRDSRKLRKGRERTLILTLIKQLYTKSQLADLFFDQTRVKLRVPKHPLVKRIKISYKQSFKIKVKYQPEASEVEKETYYASLFDFESSPGSWKP